MRDSNNPKDYVWDLAPEYVEDNLVTDVKISEITGKANNYTDGKVSEVTNKVTQVNSQLEEHVNNTNNPHEVTKNQVGLGNVDNYSTATTADAILGISSNNFMTPKGTNDFYNSHRSSITFTGEQLSEVKSGTIDLTRIDNVVIMSGNVNTLDNANSANNAVFQPITFPLGYRPSTEVPVNHYVPAMFDIFFGRVTIGGTLKLKVAMDNSHGHAISGVWLTNDEFPANDSDVAPRIQYIDALKKFKTDIDKSLFNIGITTDAHFDEGTWRTQAYRSLKNLNNILYLQNDINVLLSLGDNVDSEHKDKSINVENLERYCSRFSQGNNNNKMIIRGNHDSGSLPWDTTNEGNKVPATAVLSDTDQLNIFKKYLSQDGKVYNTEGSYHYKDFPDNKIRIIMVDTLDNGAITNPNGTLKYTDQWDFGIRQEQFKWIANQALGTLPNDYHVVICTHVPVQPQGVEEGALRNADVMRTLLNAFVNKTTAELRSNITDFTVNLNIDFSSRTQSNLIGLFSGHRHEEFFYKPDQMGGFYSTVLDCAFVRDDSKIGTVQEDAFCVLSIDTDKRSVSRLGFGRESSLLYTY